MEKYKLTPAEIEDLEKRGFKHEELSKAKHKIYSLEDWLKGDPISLLLPGWGISPHYLDEKHNTVPKEKGELTLFILPESEWLKIEQCKEEKLKGFVLAYFEALVESFEIKEKGSLEPILLAESELRKVKDLIEDKFPKCTTGWIYSNLTLEKIPSIWLQYRNDCGDKSNLSYWFKKVCVNGENGVRYVSHRHTTLTANELNSLHPDDLHFVVSALAFHRFKRYLETKLLGNQDLRVKDFPLYPFFQDGQKLDLALRAAFETGLTNEDGKWGHIGEKTKAASIFWRAAVTAGLAKADTAAAKISTAIGSQFSFYLGPNAIDKKREIADFGEDYKELYKSLLKIMRP